MGIGLRDSTPQIAWGEAPPELSQLPPGSNGWKYLGFALISTAVIAACVLAIMERLALGITAGIVLSALAIATWVFGLRSKRRREIVDNAIETLASLLRARRLSRNLIVASRWRGDWIGTPSRVRIHYAKSVNGKDPVWMGRILDGICTTFEADYLVAGHNHRSKRIWLVRDDSEPEAGEAKSEEVQKVEDIVKELLGESALVECLEKDVPKKFVGEGGIEREELVPVISEVTVRHKQGIHMAMGGRRQRVERVVSARLPGRWTAHWDLQNDIVRFTQRPEMPTTVYPVYMDVEEGNPHDIYLKLTLPYGVDENGNLITWQPALNPHMLIVGGTGTGKTVVEHGFVEQIARLGYRIWIIDGKRIEFVGFRGYPNVELVASRVEHQVRMIIAAHEMMEERYTLIEAGKATLKDFDPLFLVIDEYATLRARILRWYKSVKQKGDPTQPPVIELIEDLARLARSAKIHMVVGLQRADVTFLGGEMRDNFAARISMGRLSPQGANMMWDSFAIGVALPRNLRGRGISNDADSNPVEIQTFWNPDPAKGDLPEYLEKARPREITYQRMMILDPDMETDLDGNTSTTDEDPGYSDYANARIVPYNAIIAGEIDQRPETLQRDPVEPLPEEDLTEQENTEVDDIDELEDLGGLFEGYLPAGEGRASSIHEGDVVLMDESLGLWGVVELIDEEDNGYLIVDYRDLETGEADSASVPEDSYFQIGRPKDN